MCNELRLNFQIGVLRELYKRELITKAQLDKCVVHIQQAEKGEQANETSGSILPG